MHASGVYNRPLSINVKEVSVRGFLRPIKNMEKFMTSVTQDNRSY